MLMSYNHICITGTAKNWAWSFIDFNKDTLSPSYYGNKKAPQELSSNKKPGYILWAFNKESDYNRLKEIVTRKHHINVVLVTNSYRRSNVYVPRGFFAFGKIDKEELLIGKVSWDYWPENPKKKEGEKEKKWDYKFFIKIEKLAPRVKESLNILKSLRHENFDVNVNRVLKLWSHDVIDIIPSNVTQGSLFEIDNKTYDLLTLISNIRWRETRLDSRLTELKASVSEDFKQILLTHLISGKNVIIYGPPGIGKTEIAKKIATNICGGFDLVTGNPQWTTYDTIGGPRLPSGEYQPGFFTTAVVNCWRNLRNNNCPYWLIIDEINRANVDTAFGEAFTAFDIVHRHDVKLVDGSRINLTEAVISDVLIDNSLYIPYSFRVIATMNSYDRALLFKLGFALLRRFAIVPLSPKYELALNNEPFLSTVSSILRENVNKQISVDRHLIESQLKLSREEVNDYALIKKEYYNKFIGIGIDGYETIIYEKLNFSPIELVEAIRYKINTILEDTDVVITEALSADVIKFLVTSCLVLGDKSFDRFRGLLDEAVAAYMLPQLDILSEKIRAEKLGIETNFVTKKVDEIKTFLESLSLDNRSLPLLRKLLRGERIL